MPALIAAAAIRADTKFDFEDFDYDDLNSIVADEIETSDALIWHLKIKSNSSENLICLIAKAQSVEIIVRQDHSRRFIERI